MSGATFSRIKNWAPEVLTNTDLNAEIDNILNNLGPAGVDDYSTNVAQMQLQTSPGALGTESLATSLSGEIERIRFVIQRILGTGTPYWYQAPSSSISDIVSALGTTFPSNRIVSGKTTANSSQMNALVPSGTTNSVTLSATATPFVYYIAGTQYSITADTVISGLATASSTNNTATFANTTASGQQWTKALGQGNTTIDITAAQSGITGLVGQIASFLTGTEPFIAYINSTTQLTNAWRGSMFNATAGYATASSLSDGATLTLLKTTWVFATTASAIAVTYSNPSVSVATPSAPAIGDYWFDLGATIWKTFNSTSWVDAHATLIGLAVQNTTACIGARTFDSYKAASDTNSLEVSYVNATQAQVSNMFAEVSVYSKPTRYQTTRLIWDITQHLESGVVEAASTVYYLYVTESGAPIISDKIPLTRRDRHGSYHPFETWRCVGSISNDGSSNFAPDSVRTYGGNIDQTSLTGSPLPNQALLPGVVTAFGTTFNYGAVGQHVRWAYSGQFTASSLTSAASFNDIIQLTVGQGIWDVSGALYFSHSSSIANVEYSVHPTAGTAGLTFISAWNSIGDFISGTATGIQHSRTERFNVILTAASTPTIYYFKLRVTNLTMTGAASAIAKRLDSPYGTPP